MNTAPGVIAIGTDLVPVERIGQMRENHGERFLTRVFTTAELDYALAGKRRTDEHLAARFAAKEATFKALGTGWSHGIGWTDIELTRTHSGEPALTVTGKAGEIASRRGITRWLVSVSHIAGLASATVLALGAEDHGRSRD